MSQLGRRQRAVRHALCNVVASQRTVGTDAVALVLAHGLEDGLADLLPPAVAGSGNSSVHDRIAETIGMPASWPWVSVDARSFSPAPTLAVLELDRLGAQHGVLVAGWVPTKNEGHEAPRSLSGAEVDQSTSASSAFT